MKPLKGFSVLIMRTSQTRLLGSAALRLMLPAVLTLAAPSETSRRVCELRIILKGEARIWAIAGGVETLRASTWLVLFTLSADRSRF